MKPARRSQAASVYSALDTCSWFGDCCVKRRLDYNLARLVCAETQDHHLSYLRQMAGCQHQPEAESILRRVEGLPLAYGMERQLGERAWTANG